ncbi:unnamed protein product [Moneuplotes crassus]|uniref:Uncharacterized protein n=1 Tax=Euplotes crassus TaxID=5936 RepID=A0AAD1XUZ4_EUPCR|nr:unnamed protein product [Moneuplotes crassus]
MTDYSHILFFPFSTSLSKLGVQLYTSASKIAPSLSGSKRCWTYIFLTAIPINLTFPDLMTYLADLN